MIHCICKGVNTKLLLDSIDDEKDLKQIIKDTGIGSKCGVCLKDTCCFIKKEIQNRN